MPPQIKYIIGNEACERLSYYGMLGILENYLKDRFRQKNRLAATAAAEGVLRGPRRQQG